MYTFPPRSRVLVEREEIEYVCAGNGAATVVLVNGSGGPIEGWHKIFEPVSSFAKVIAYNRPGIGKSSKPIRPQTGSHMVESLRAVLTAAGLPPPYVFIGHSLGGLIVNLFARRYPSAVASAILIEATAPKDVEILPRHENALQRALKKVLDKMAPPDPNAETEHVKKTVLQIAEAPTFPPIPLIIISGSKPALVWATKSEALVARAAHQRELVSLSPLGKHLLAARSGHFPQFTEPELVVSAIREMADLALPGGTGPC